MSLFPLITFDLVSNDVANELLTRWDHALGSCRRPFRIQSFALVVRGVGAVAVAVSASTVSATCANRPRTELLELARLCADPANRWAMRVSLRLWREIAPLAWPDWQVKAVVSYADATRHTGNIYRFDGWTKVKDVPGGTAGDGWQKGTAYKPKSLWLYDGLTLCRSWPGYSAEVPA